MTKHKPLLKLVWMVDGKIKETIDRNYSKAILLSKKAKLSQTTHKTGLLIIQKN